MRAVIGQYEGIDATPALPLAAGVLVATARQDPALRGAELAIAVERAPLADAVAALAGAELFGASLYPWNAAYALAVAAAARAADPSQLIVAGGPMAPRRPDAARAFLDAHPAIDVLVLGEGELAFAAIAAARARGAIAPGDLGALAAVPGLVLRGAPGAAHAITAPPARVLDFGATGSPFLDGTFDELLARHPRRFAMALCETNRGCPFSCTFCDWSLTKKVVEVPLARVRAELDWVTARGFRHVMLADANFGIRPRDPDLARHLVARRRDTGAPTSFYFYLTKNDHARNLETIEILQGGGIGTWIGLAVQDFDDDVLAAVKRDRIQTGEAQRLRAICGARGIPTFNELILGLPGQTYASFTETIATAMPAWPRHDFVLFHCRLIENSELGSAESRARHGLETRRCAWKTATPGWDPIVDETQELVVATRDLPLADWRRAFAFAFVAAAAYNLRLLRVVIQVLDERGVLGRRALIERIAIAMEAAPPGSALAALGAIVARYAASILASGPLVLPPPPEPGAAPEDAAAADAPDADGAADAPADTALYVDEALAWCALARYDELLAEVLALVRAAAPAAADADRDVVAEAFRYQRLVTPRWGATAPTVARFAHDWPAYVAAGGTDAPLAARAITVRATPPPYAAAPRFATFAATFVGMHRARLEPGTVEVVGAAPPPPTDEPAAPARPRALIVLPTSG